MSKKVVIVYKKKKLTLIFLMLITEFISINCIMQYNKISNI